MDAVKGLRRAVFAVFLVCGAFLGHELAYALHFGVVGALSRQATGVHRYFLPASELAASLLLGLVSLCLLLVVLLRSVVRVRRPAPARRDVFRSQAALFAGQLAFYVVQESIEASMAHTGPQSLCVLLACGLVAQAIVSLVAGWLFALVWAPVAAHYDALAASPPLILGLDPTTELVGTPAPCHIRSAAVRDAHAPRAPPAQLTSSILLCRA